LVPSSQSFAALDFDADLTAVTGEDLASFRIIHFAVHALLDSVRPTLSSLVLSLVDPFGNRKDGFLRLHQIYNLNLPVELVVLGACETAMGNEIRGEGLESLARGFMHAGAARLIGSLWQVDDESASELMKVFYRRLLGKPQQRPAAALREAQLEIMRNLAGVTHITGRLSFSLESGSSASPWLQACRVSRAIGASIGKRSTAFCICSTRIQDSHGKDMDDCREG
jgi:CHAT domain-containing protein